MVFSHAANPDKFVWDAGLSGVVIITQDERDRAVEMTGDTSLNEFDFEAIDELRRAEGIEWDAAVQLYYKAKTSDETSED